MNAIRILLSVFVLILIALVVLGLMWAGAHQPPPARTASYVVLGISGIAGVLTLFAIWRHQPRRAR
ncbi:MAG TPA: hypothetical protein VF198_07170 [Vicinamibacterales bacterium]